MSSSSLSLLAPPFTVDRSPTASLNPSTLPLPPPAGASITSSHIYPSTAQSSSAYSSSAAVAPYFNSSGETAWSSPPAASSRLSTLNFGFRFVEAAPYYPYYASLSDSAAYPSEQVLNYKGYPGAYGTFDAEEGRPSRGSRVASFLMDPSPSCKMSLPSQKRGTIESFSAYEDTFDSFMELMMNPHQLGVMLDQNFQNG